MTGVVIREEARIDLQEIYAYIVTDSERAALNVVLAFERLFSLLAVHPMLGRRLSSKSKRARFYSATGIIRNYGVIFRPIEAGIEVLQILHGAKNQPSSLRDIPEDNE